MSRVIPCIDLMGGKVVQLRRGEEKALELDSPDEALEMFRAFPLLHIIDLDAAMRRGWNKELVAYLLKKVRARVGGGVRTATQAAEWVVLGAEQVIIGTAAFHQDGVNEALLKEVVSAVGRERVIVAVDVREGRIAVKGWQSTLALTPSAVMTQLEPYCSGFLCTYVDQEGMLQGTNLPFFLHLRSRTGSTLIAAGGISTLEEVRTLLAADIEVALGMAVYTGALSLADLAAMTS